MGGNISNEYINTTNELPPDVPEQMTWMSRIEDRTPFTMLSIPGTHCSCSAYLNSPSWRHQSLNILQSLKAGIRFFDVHMRLEKENKLMLWQDCYTIQKDMDSLLEPLVYFMATHMYEVIIVCLTEAFKSNGRPNFSDTVYQKIHENVPRNNIWMYYELPETVGEARGKIIFLRNYSDGEARFVPFHNCVSSNRTGETTIYEEFWKKQKKSLINAQKNANPELHITYLSHKDLYCNAAYTINKRLFELLSQEDTKVRLGVVAMDFPGSLLIQKIIKTNIFCNTTDLAGENNMKEIEWHGRVRQSF